MSRLKTELGEVITRCRFLEKEVRNTKDLERLKYENRKQYREWKGIIALLASEMGCEQGKENANRLRTTPQP